MLMCAHTHGCAHIRIYTHVRTYTHTRGNFLTSNLLYSIVKLSSIISPTTFTHIIQSLYNPYPYWHRHRYVICTNHQHLPLIYHHLPSISNHPQQSTIYICLSSPNSYPTPSHNYPSSRTYHPIVTQFPLSSITHIITNLISYDNHINSLYICRVLIYFLIYATFSYIQITASSIYWLHY